MNKTSSAIVRSFLLGSSALCAFTIGVQANPTGGVVVSGSATITNSGSGATTTIDQKTGKVVIDWSTFSIGSGATVQFNQPGSSAIALNRVTGNQPSSIYGNLLANGQVWIINGNGILFGKGAQINVGGLIATTADLTNDDFLSGDYSFNGATGASVVNQGTIRAKKGGYAVLSGANVSNQGLIAADTGTVVIGGAKSYTVDFQGDGLLKYAITAPADKASASNSGTIKAQGGRVVMTARAAQSVQDAVVNNTGMISATSAKVGQDGEVILDGGDGDVAVSGTVDVSGTAPGTTGGTVAITGRNVTVADGTTIDASGAAGGGTVNIGGNLHGQGPLAHATNVTVGKATITADATDSGNGGQVVVWSDNDTSFAGSVSAKGGASGGDGGMVETSGHNLNVDPAVEIDTTAPKGKTGTWLIDPTNIFIVDGDQGTLDGNGNAPVGSGPTNDLLAPSTIVAALATTDVSLQASNQIEVVNNIDYTSSHTLSMLAQGSIIVLADIQNAGTGAINLVAGWDGTTTNTADFTNPGVYGNNGGTITLENDLSSAAISGHLATVGSAGGVVTLAAAGLSLDETDNRVQIGYDGNGGGDIDIVLTGDLTIDKQGTDDTFIGNGAFDSDVTGAATGNISINAGGTLTLTDANPGSGHLWIGNQGAPTFGETGNVTLIAGTIAEGTDLGPMIVADLGGGDVTLGVSNGDLAVDGASYDSSHNLTLLASGDLELPQTLSNDGTGSITLVAGWDGHSLGSALGQAGTYGNGNGFTTIGGENASGDVFVGSAGGSTTVYTGELDVFAENGSAQLGYDGAGSGDITVKATGNVELMGGDPSSSTMVAMIGNGSVADEIDAPVGGNISIDAGATFVIASVDGTLPSGNVGGGFGSGGGLPGGGDCGPDCILGLPPGGGGGAPLQQSGELPTVFIGNSAGRGTGAVSGSVTLTALDFDDTADSNGGFSAIIADDIVNGDVTIGQRDGEGFVELDHDFSYDSSHNLTVLSGDGLGVDAVIQNGGSGNITLIAGWDGITAPGAINAGTTSAYGFNGANGSVIYVGDGCVESCTYDAEIGTKSGTLSAFGGSLNVDASEGYAQLGYHGAGSGDIVVGTIGGITLQGGNSSDPEWDAQIGNGSVARDAGGNVSGNITITSGGTLDIEDGDGGIGWIGNAASGDFQETGNVTLVASSITGGDISFIAGDLGTSSDTGGDVFVGVTGADGWSIDQDIAYNSPHTLTLASVGNLQFDNTVQNDGTGNLNLVAGWDGTFTDMAQIVSSADYGANGATIFIGGSSQNENVSVGAASGTTTVLTGNLTIVPEGDLYGQLGYHGDGGGDITVTALGNITLEAGGSGSQYAQIGNGSIEEGQVSGPANGNIDVEAKGTLNLISDDQVGSDWIGNASDNSGSGAVTIVAADLGQTDRLAQMLRTDVQGGDTTLGITDANSGSTFSDGITYSSAFTLSILTAGNLTIAGAIQNSSSGQLNIVAGWDGTTFDATQFDAAGVYGNNSGIINIGGSGATGAVSVGSKGGTLVAGGDIHVNAAAFDAQIGYGDPAQGNIEVDATRDVTVETLVGSGGGLTARIGNGTAGASGIFGGTITIHAQDLSMIAGDSGDMVQVGNGGTNTTGSYAGDITVNLSGQLEMGAEGQNQIVQIGNGGSHGTGEAGGAIDIDAGSLLMRGDTGATGSFVQIGNGGSSFIGRAEDDINVTVSGALTIEELAGEPVWIGNLSSGSSGATYLGDATISAGSASGLASTVSDVLAGGDLEIEIFGDLDWNQDLTIDSDKTLNLLAAGNITFDASLKNSGGGTLNIVAGWDGATTDPALFGNGGVYGNNGGSVTIGGQNAGGDVSVGSATGIVNLFTDNLTVEADNGHAELGFDDEISGLSGGINVTAVDSVTLTGSDDDGVFAQIGNGVDLGDNGSGGGVGIVAGSMSQSGTAGIVGGTVSLATNDGGIGDGDNAISVTSTSLSISAAGDDAFVNSPNTGVSLSNVDMNGGSLTLVADGSVTQTGSISADALDIDTTGSSDGTVTLDDTGNSFASLSLDSGAGADIYDSQDLSINTAAVGEGATLTLASGGGITQSGEITADNLSVTSGTGDIVLDDTDNAINGLSVTTTGGHDATIFSNETIDLQTVSVEGTLTLNTTDGVTQEQSLSAGALNVTSGESGITLDNDGNDVTGDVSLNSGGDAVFHNDTDISAGASSVTGTLTLVSADGITQDGAIGAGTLSATANGGAITLDNTGNAFGTLNVSTTGDFDATVADTGDLDISGADVGGLLTLSTTGAISQDGALSAGSLSATAGAGGITLNTDGNSVAGDVSLNSGGDAIFNDGTDILVGASNVTGTLTLVSADGITQDGAISAGTLSLDANGAITLDDDGNSFGALDVSAPGSGTVSITDSTGVVLDDIQTGGDFTLNAAGDVTQNDALGITGTLSVTTTNGGAVTLDNVENVVSGDVAFDGAADVTFDSAGAVDLDASSAVGTLTISANGPIIQSGVISTDALDVTTTGSGNGITLDDTDNSFNTLTVNSSAGAVITDSLDLSVSSAIVAEGATLTLTSAGGISQTGDIDADNLDATSGTGDIVLDDSNNAIGGLSVTTTGGHDATISSDESIDLQTVSVSGALTLNTTGGVTQEQGLSAGGLNVTAGESGITLDNDGNDVTGDVSLNAGGDAVFHNDTDISMGASNVTGTLTLVSAGGITQDGAIGANALVATANGGAIVLDDPSNAFASLTVSTAGNSDATFVDTGALDIAASTVGGTLTVTTDGEITQSGAITAAGLTATSQDSDLGFGFNNFISGDVSLTAATDATFFNEGQLTVGTSNVGGLLSLTSSSAGITQDGAISADTLSLTAPGGVTLDNGGNSFNALDLFVSGTNANVVSDASSLELDDVSVGGDLVLSSGGDIAQTQPISVGGALTANADNGTITLDETGNDIGGTVSLNASGDATFDNGTDTDLGTSIVGGTLTVASDGAITQSGALTAGTLDVSTTSGSITLANTNNDFDTLQVATGGTDDATIVDGTDVTVSGATVGGTLSLTASSIGQSGAIGATGLNLASTFGVTLDDGGNSFQTLSVSGGNASVTDSTGVSLGAIDLGGRTFTLSAGGTITQTGTITAREADISTTSGAIVLTNPDNVADIVSFTTAGGDATIVDNDVLTVGADLGGDTSETGGTLTVTAQTIFEGDSITAAAVNATATLSSIGLDNSDNDVGSFNVTTTGTDNGASLTNSGTLNISGANVSGSLDLTSINGGITQSGAITSGDLLAGAATASPNPGDNDIVLTNPDNDVSGRFEVSTPNNASFTNSQSIAMDESEVDGTLTLVSGGAITQLGGGDLTVGTLTATAGEGSGITLNEADNAIGTLNLTTFGGDASITDSTGVVLGTIDVDGHFALFAGGDVTQTQALSISNGFDISTSSGDITLDNPGNDVTGTVSFGGADNVTYVNDQGVDLGASIVGGTLSITAGGDISQEAGLQADELDVSTSNGSITLDSAKNTFNTLNVSTAGEGAGDATLVDASDLTVASADVEGTLTLTAASIGQSGSINAGALNVTSTEGGITLQDPANAFGALSVTTGGSDAAVNDSQGFDLTGADVGSGTVTLSADGAITQSGAITAGEVDVSTTTGSITLDDADNAFGALNVSTQGDDGATIVDTGDLTVTGATIGGTLFLTAGSIGQTGEIDANALGVTGANGITLDNANNKFSGLEVSTTDADALITDAWGIDIYAANTGAGVLTINSGGMVTQEADADITAGGLNVSADPRGIVLNNQGNAVSGDVTFDTDGDVTFHNDQQVTFGQTTVGGTLTVFSGAGIDQDGAISAGTLTATAGEGTITLTDSGNAFGTLNLTTTSSSDVAIVDSTGVDLGAIDSAGRLILSAGGDVTQSQALNLSNGFDISTSNGDITLDNPGNDVTGTVSFDGTNNVTYVNGQGVDLGASIVGGTLSITAGGDITQEAGLSADELDVSANDGAITLDSAKNTFNTLNVSTVGEGAGAATLVDASDLTVASADVEGTLTLTAASAGQSGSINAGALNVTATEGGITLQDGGNAFGALSVTTGGSDAAVNDSQGFDLTGADVGSGTVTLSADGAITQS
ncbi:MAG TPA: filamentous hemagglutinin N-terminal domain-containing protein, partial [Rhizomicrobium sp.]|nr:filamentous hemagglutinin N-terminal domain-containing protein [Rhizomicrobium sp.]